jgi:membrane-associated phospholipid phosphatase
MLIPISTTATLKGLYYDARPWVMFEEVKAHNCLCDSGMPSGHTVTSISSNYGLYLMIIDLLPSLKNNTLINFAIRNTLKIVLACISLFIMASRIALGSHFIN